MKKLFLLTILLTSTICSNAQEFSVVILGDGYGSAKAQFTADASDVQKGMLDRPPFRQRRNQIVFYQGSYNNKFACKVISGNASLSHALDCSWSKIFKEAASVHPYSLVIVLVNKQGYGTGNTGIAVIGTGAHDNLTATNNLLGATYSERLQIGRAHV